MTANALLECLTDSELIDIRRVYQIAVPDDAVRSLSVAAIFESQRSLSVILRDYKRDRLKDICRQLKISDKGTKKADLAARLTGEAQVPRYVKTVQELIRRVREFSEEFSYARVFRALRIKQTQAWVYDVSSGYFAPARYAALYTKDSEIGQVQTSDGADPEVQLRVLLKTSFIARPELHDKLKVWGVRYIERGFDPAPASKFVEIESASPASAPPQRDHNGLLPIREGAEKRQWIKKYERSTEARERCLKHYGSAVCQVCDLDMGQMYPGVGAGFIHVHHIVPLSLVGEDYKLNPEIDLLPVCPNCHSMLHQRPGEPYSPAELRAIVATGRARRS